MLHLSSNIGTIVIDANSINLDRGYDNSDRYRFWDDKKWSAFKKKFNLHFRGAHCDDFYKWYEMYLRLCAEGLF